MARRTLDTGIVTTTFPEGAVLRPNYQALIWDDAEHQDGWTFESLTQSGGTRVTKDGSNRVSAVASRKTGGAALTQVSSVSYPLWIDADLNGKPVIQVAKNASTNPDRLAYTWPQIALGDFSLVLVVRSDTPTQNVVMFGTTNTARKTTLTNANNTMNWRIDNSPNEAGAVLTNFDTSGAWQMIVASFDRSTGTAKISRDGAAPVIGVNAAAAPDVTSVSFGAQSNVGPNVGWDGRFALIDLWNCDLHDPAKATKYGWVKQLVRGRTGLTIA